MAKKKFKLFDSQRKGKGVYKRNVEKTPGLKKFWRIYRDNFFNRLLYINIIMIIGNLPLIFWIMAIAGVGQGRVMMPNDGIFSILWGIGGFTEQTPASLAMLGVAGVQGVTYTKTFVTYLFYGLGCLTFLSWGVINVGVAYILRNLATERPIFMFSDMGEIIKKNWKQALPFGIIDLLLLFMLPYNIYSVVSNGGGYISSLFFWVTIVVIFVYLVMRWYIYLQIVSFKMKMTRIIKNALYFVLLGAKRNALAMLGNVLLIFLTILFLFGFGGQLLALALFIPALMLFSHTSFMGYYAAWYKIEEIMVVHDKDEGDDTGSGEVNETELPEEADDLVDPVVETE